LLFALALLQSLRQDPWSRPISIDNQIYFYVAHRVAQGTAPHVSLVDHKNALSAMLSGWTMLAGRTLGVDDVFSARALGMVAAASLPPTLWVLAYGATRNVMVAHVTALVALTFEEFFAQGATGLRPQLFMATFLSQSFAALGAGRSLLAGGLAIASFLCWQPAMLAFAATSLALLVARGPWSRWVRYAVGGAVALGLYEAYFLVHGALGEQWFQAYVMRSDLTAHTVKPLAESLGFVLRGGRWGEGWTVVFPAVFLLYCAGIVCEPWVRPRRVWRRWRESPAWGAVNTTAVLALGFTLFDHQAFPDRFFLLPFVALANGVLWGTLASRVCVRWWGAVSGRRLATAALIVGAIAVVPHELTIGNTPADEKQTTLAAQRRLAARVLSLSERYGPVWAIGCPHLLALAELENHDSIGLVIDPHIQAHLAALGGEDGYRPKRGMPAVLLTARGGEALTFPWLRKEYWLTPDEAFSRQGIRVWLRRECLLAGRRCPGLFECYGTIECRRGEAPASPH
jgi:hypothetical protein